MQFFFRYITLITICFSPLTSLANGKITETIISRECSRHFKLLESKYHMPKNLMRAIAYTESGKWSNNFQRNIVWPWTINSHGKGWYFKTKKEAIAKVNELKKMGRKSIDVGCMQINLKYHPNAFKNLDDALNPKINIDYAAKFIADKYKRHKSWETAIRYYHSKRKKYSDIYLKRVLRIWDQANLDYNQMASLSNSVNNKYPIIYMNKKDKYVENPYNMYINEKSIYTAFLD